MRKLNILTLISCCALTSFAQENLKTCGHTQVTNELWSKNPQGETNYQKLVQHALKKQSSYNKSTVLIIPIVFHVVHEYGSENISDAQVYDELDILNEDYRKVNPDTSAIISQFDTIAADCHIEFRLPTIDYAGNCTNGIEHIYSHETNIGDDFSKIHQWDRNKYLNVWVVRSMRNGVAGYAYYPSDINNSNLYADGVIILSDYIGSVGTGSPGKSRALTHEIGHYLGLSHPWGSTNNPGVACGDDQIPDTPITKGYDFCPGPSQAKICDTAVVENYQNYMDYSYCSMMFTEDQSTVMNSILSSSEAQRSILTTDQNLVETGISVSMYPFCKPVADFSSNNKLVCQGDPVTFRDVSWNSTITSRIWTFQDGTPSTSTSANQSVTFSSPGWKAVKLYVQNVNGADSLTIDQYIYVTGNADITGPSIEDFEGDYSGWLVQNPEGNEAKWQFDPHYGAYNTAGFRIQNFYQTPSGVISDYEFFYNDRLGLNKDALISPAFDLSTTSNTQLVFNYAYATQAVNESQLTEVLNVYSSKNCGKTWTLRKTLSGGELITAGNYSSDFNPNNIDFWKTCVIDMSAIINSTDTETRFKFEFVSSDHANNLFLDNINVSGVLGIKENPLNQIDLEIFPNPVNGNEKIQINYMANEHETTFELTDLSGQLIFSATNTEKNKAVSYSLNPAKPIASGYYLLKVSQGKFSRTEKIIVL